MSDASPPSPLAASPPLAAPPASSPPPPGGWRRLGRALRISTALLLLLLSVWSLLLPVSVPISTAAAVTARVAAVATPIAGDVVTLAGDTGDPVGLGDLLAEVKNPQARDRAGLDELEARGAELEGQRGALEAELAALEAERAVVERRVQEDAQRIVREAERHLAESERTYESLLAAKALKEAALGQLQARRERSALDVVSEADLAAARQEVELAGKLAAIETERSARLREHVADARAGSFVALSVRPADAPRLAELVARLARLALDRGRLEAQARQLEGQVASAERRALQTAQRRVTSPVRGVIWQRTANVGQYVDAGKELYRVADGRTVQVQAYFHRRYLDGLALGHKASVYLVAARRVVVGTVKVVQSIDAARAREEFAIDLPAPDEDHFKVVLELDEEGRKLAEIGSVAKVAVLGELDGRAQRALMWLYLRFES